MQYRVLAGSGLRSLAMGVHIPVGAVINEAVWPPHMIKSLLTEGLIEPVEEQGDTNANPLLLIDGVDEQLAAAINTLGFDSIEDVATATVQQLAFIPGVGKATAGKLIDNALALLQPEDEPESDGA